MRHAPRLLRCSLLRCSLLLTPLLSIGGCSSTPAGVVDAAIQVDTVPVTDQGPKLDSDSTVADAARDTGTATLKWQKVTTVQPRPVSLFALTTEYDDKASRVLLVAGRTSVGLDAELWQLKGSQWTERTPSPNPLTPRMNHGSAYDSKRDRLVVFGGLAELVSPYSCSDDTWEWDGTQWKEVKPAKSPAGRAGAAMAFDAARGVVVLFGGTDNQLYLDDTWTWDGTTWTELKPAKSPSQRINTRMVYDAKRQRVVLFGGHSMATSLADTWEWDGSAWTDVTPKQGNPPAVGFHAMTYNADSERVLLLGGSDEPPPFLGASMYNELWQWDSTQWTKLTVSGPAPVGRCGHGLAYDRAGKRLLVFGGLSMSAMLDDLWQVAWN